MIFDWTDGETGRTRKLNKQDMAEMQTILAECLGMERGISSDRKAPFRHPVQEYGRSGESGANRKRMQSDGG